MKKAILLLTAVLGSLSAWAQAQTPPPGAISRPPPSRGMGSTNANASTTTNELGLGNLTFTNQAGATYSVAQLAGQLRNLRGAIEQTLPMLAAFTESFTNSAGSTGQDSIAGAIAAILGVLRRNTNQATGQISGQSSAETNNLLSVLDRLLTTNAPGAVSINPNTLQDLVTLQTDLQPVVSTLDNLHVGSSTNEVNPPRNGRLTPTGR